ncbi:MAG TPA: hypothetical protein VGL62_14085 [Vicinamibacterales bacterium]|jgi:hypothetical protein
MNHELAQLAVLLAQRDHFEPVLFPVTVKNLTYRMIAMACRLDVHHGPTPLLMAQRGTDS